MLAARITLPHFSVSSAMSFPKSAGEPVSTDPPKSARLAEEIHKFACDVLPKHFSDENKKILIVNYANSLNLQKRHTEAAKILDAHDWSASASKFRISVAAVKNDSTHVGSLIKEIGASGSVAESDYQEWPVFSPDYA